MLRQRITRLGMAAALFSAHTALASTLAIIDSGTDLAHPQLASKIWTNPGDSTKDFRDNDGNGFVDDINGWNFFANSNSLIDLKYADLFSSDIEEFFAIQDKFLLGEATEAELAWIKEKVAQPEFVKSLTAYGTFVHGTHVAGIAANGNPSAKIATLRLVPVENPLLSLEDDILRARAAGQSPSAITKGIIKAGLYLLASAQGTAFGMVGTYVNSTKADVANASLGVGMMQAKIIVTPLVKLAMGGKEPDAASIEELAKYFVEQAVKSQSKIATNAPDTLFVFASGNDGTNNDLYPVSPANIGLGNTISVGASIEFSRIAPFSNFGKKVDVLAPGVGIVSSVPAGRTMSLTGTSQAAPFVAGLAAKLKDANPKLKPADLKALIIGTVDIKAELADKTASSGIVNTDRALAAAEASKTVSVAEAISSARMSVADQSEATSIQADNVVPFNFVTPLLVNAAQ